MCRLIWDFWGHIVLWNKFCQGMSQIWFLLRNVSKVLFNALVPVSVGSCLVILLFLGQLSAISLLFHLCFICSGNKVLSHASDDQCIQKRRDYTLFHGCSYDHQVTVGDLILWMCSSNERKIIPNKSFSEVIKLLFALPPFTRRTVLWASVYWLVLYSLVLIDQ